MKNEVICKKKMQLMIKEIIRGELKNTKQELEELKQKIQRGIIRFVDGAREVAQRRYYKQ